LVSKFNRHLIDLEKKYPNYWSVISKAPYFDSLYSWSNNNRGWNGSGLFLSNSTIQLNQKEDELTQLLSKTDKKFNFETRSEITENVEHITDKIIYKSNWKQIQEFKYQYDKKLKIKTIQSGIWEKKSWKGDLLRRTLKAYSVKSYGRNQIEEYDYLDKQGNIYPLKNVFWADFDFNDKLIYTKYGKVYRAEFTESFQEYELIDLNEHKPPSSASH